MDHVSVVDNDFNRTAITLAEQFVNARRKEGLGFDFSVESLETLDQSLKNLLGDFVAAAGASPIDEPKLQKRMYTHSAYLGEVIRRNSDKGYYWIDESVMDDDRLFKLFGESFVYSPFNLTNSDKSFIVCPLGFVMSVLAGQPFYMFSQELGGPAVRNDRSYDYATSFI
jgi:hypothetical protein